MSENDKHSSVPEDSQLKEPSPAESKKILRNIKIGGIAVLALLIAGTAVRVYSRVEKSNDLKEITQKQAIQYVSTIQAKKGQDGEALVLPGTLRGFVESPIYARSTGYVVRWFHDIGTHVEKGQPLAEIDTPEVDQQLAQAKAARQQVASSLSLTKSSYERWKSLRERDAVTQQELDERTSAYHQAKANLDAADADIKRLQKLTAFKHIVAPFSGTITNRAVDVGDLINAGNGGEGKALFTLAQIDPLRIYVNVPQVYAHNIKVGDEVSITQAELPNQVFNGKIAHTAGAINTSTSTLQVEVRLSNLNGKLLPGAYVQASFPTQPSHSLVVPINTLLFRAEGPSIGIVINNQVKLHPVKIGRDFGKTVEILGGISEQDQLIVNPSDALADGDQVAIKQVPVQQPPQKKAAS